MMPNEKILEILKRLLEKSRLGQVNWSQSDRDDDFFVAFPDSRLCIRYISPRTELDRIAVSVKSPTDKELWRVDLEDGSPGWAIAHDLFLEAKRLAVGLDAVLEQMEKAIGEPSKVGVPF